MNKDYFFSFTTDLTSVPIPKKLNNPFHHAIPPIAQISIEEFQEFLSSKTLEWGDIFQKEKGKMFGILVVETSDGELAYLGSNSGKLPNQIHCNKFIPSVLNDSEDDFLNVGMNELMNINHQRKLSQSQEESDKFSTLRKQKSIALQQRLFEHYTFMNVDGVEKNVLQIFSDSLDKKPPSAAGECAAPKLLQYALQHQLRPIAIAEFWWGKSTKNKEKEHQHSYPACEKRCKPILEYMLNDTSLFQQTLES